MLDPRPTPHGLYYLYRRLFHYKEEEEVIHIGQGYRYALRDQDAFCLAMQGSLQGNKRTTGVGGECGGGGILRGRRGMGWCGGYKYGLSRYAASYA